MSESLREAFQASMRIAGDGTACPRWETIWDSARRHLPRREEDTLLMHVSECAACAAAWRVARELAGPAALRRWSSWWLPATAAAAAVFGLVLIGVSLLDRGAPSTPTYRARDGAWLQSLVPEDAPLKRQDCVLRWRPGPDGTTYQVRVTNDALEVLARGRGLAAAEYRVPPAALESVPSGAKIFWQVTARLPDGTVVDSNSFISHID